MIYSKLNKSLITSYPNDTDIQALLFEQGEQYIWGNTIWGPRDLTYSFTDYNSFSLDQAYNDSIRSYTYLFENGLTESVFKDPNNGLQTFTEAEKEIVRESLSLWSDASGINFIEVEETTGLYGDIRLFNLDFDVLQNYSTETINDAAAFAYAPYYDGFDDILEGDVFINSKIQPGDGFYEHVVFHELGHSIGLSHPFEGYLNLDLKSHETAMTYDSNYYLPNGTMPADIKAAEFLYGGNPNANTENNTYSWSAYENLNYRNAIIDKGGTDTIDLSNHNNGVFINLNSDSWSSLSYNGNSNNFQNKII